MDSTELVRAFIGAFDEERIEALAETLHPEVEIHGSRGLRRGIDEARAWATRAPTGELHQRVLVDEIHVAGDRAGALIRRQYWWREEGGLASENEMAWAFELRDGLVASWRSFDDRVEALEWLATAS